MTLLYFVNIIIIVTNFTNKEFQTKKVVLDYYHHCYYYYYKPFYAGTMPDTSQTTTGTGCANWAGNTCNPSWSVPQISVKNCGAYYVYLLSPTNTTAGYCASECVHVACTIDCSNTF